MKKLFYIFILLAGTLHAAPQLSRTYTYRYFTTRDGLVQMQVLCAFQDRDGYIWFGTKGGVSRWDGISFKSIAQEDGIPVGEMFSIGEWGNKKMFFFHNKLQFLHQNDSLEIVQLPDTLQFLGFDFWGFEISENEALFTNLINPNEIPTQKYYHLIWNKNTQKFRIWKSIDKMIIALNEHYIVTSNALYSREGLKIKKHQSLPDKYVNAQINWKNGESYFYNHLDRRIEEFSFSGKELHFKKIIASNIEQSRFLVLPNKSVVCFGKDMEPKIYPKLPADLKPDLAYLEKPFLDREGNLWITSNNGLYNFFNLNFEEYTFGLAKPDNIWSIQEDYEQNMWFGSYGWGLWRLDKKGNLKAMNQSDPSWVRQYMGSTRSKDGTLYLPRSGGITVYKDKQFKNLPTGTSLSAYYDETGKEVYYSGYKPENGIKGLWIGVDENRKFIPWKKGFPVGIGKDSKGRIRVGSFRGQGYLQGDSIVNDTIKRDYEGVISYATDKWGRLWKATTKGCYVELQDGKEFRFAPQIKGILASIWNYQDKYLLIGTGYGMAIAIMSNDMLHKPEIYEIGYENGFTGLDAGQNAFFEDHNGDMWVWTAVNVLKFNPDKLVQSQTRYIPPIRVLKIGFSADNYKWQEIIFENNVVKIDSKNKFFRIEYIANSISLPKSLRFKYRLIGFSDKWSEPVFSKEVIFTNLTFGEYTFEVQCSLDGENWSPIAVSPLIDITVPFFYRPFAWVVYLLLLALLIIFITGIVVKKNQQKKINELNRKRTENELHLNTLRSKIIPHFTKNILSAIGHFAMTDKLRAGHYISLFSKFSGLTLENADKNYIKLSDELEYIQLYLELEKMRFNNRFEFKINVENNINPEMFIPTMILHTYCDNAIRHGLVNKTEPGLLTIQITASDDGILVIIEDNGIGRKRAMELGTRGNGQGLTLIQAQIDFYSQINVQKITQQIIDLDDENEKPCGTKVILFVPFDYRFGDANQ